MHLRTKLFVGVCAVFVACATLAREETVGEHFRKVMAGIDLQCKKNKLGPYLDLSDPQYHEKQRRTDCDILMLKLVDPLSTPEGRFAHSLKLPKPHDKPKDVYKPGMTGEEYFKALCAAEAGEWVFRRVENVDGVFQARPYQQFPAGYYDLVFYTVEKGEMNVDKPQNYMVQPYMGRYNFLELPGARSASNEQQKKYIRFFRNTEKQHPTYPAVKDGRPVRIPYIVSQELTDRIKSRYGYTWRGVQMLNGIEHGIEGSELIVFDVETTETLAVRRYFVQYYPDPTYRDARYPAHRACPKFVDPAHRFIQNVLVPTNSD